MIFKAIYKIMQQLIYALKFEKYIETESELL